MNIREIRNYLGKYADNPTQNLDMTQKEAGMLILQIKNPRDAANTWGAIERTGKLTSTQRALFNTLSSLIRYEKEKRYGADRALRNRIKELKEAL